MKTYCKECGSICVHEEERLTCRACNEIGYLANVHRSQVRKALKGNKELSFSDYLGCNIVTFREHISSQFLEGMTWENYDKWHIDHKIPLKYKKDGETLQLLKRL